MSKRVLEQLDPDYLISEVESLLRGMAVDHPDASPRDIAYAIVHGPFGFPTRYDTPDD